MNTGGNGFGMLAPVVTPWLGKAYGWTTAIVVACCVCAVGGVLWFGIRLHRRRRRQGRALASETTMCPDNRNEFLNRAATCSYSVARRRRNQLQEQETQ